jgi:3-hydroxyisobutyrate dehydrogenase/2-hydroxy-3-oxopropionate reductase
MPTTALNNRTRSEPGPRTIAVLGLGSMGSRIAGRLLQAGREVLVWNRTREKMGPLVERGAVPVASPADAASRSQVVITMVADPAALAAVSEGEDGLIAGIERTDLVIEMSTVGPAAIAKLASLLPVGTHLVDAPVLGSVDEAVHGSLTVFMGGDEESCRLAFPLLSALGTPVPCGPLGAGAAAKLVANAALLLTTCGLGEVLSLSDRLALTREVAFRILETTPLDAQARRRRPLIEAGQFPPRFPLHLAAKDCGLILEAAYTATHGAPSLLGETRSWFVEAAGAGRPGDDYTAVLAHIVSVSTGNGTSFGADPPRLKSEEF